MPAPLLPSPSLFPTPTLYPGVEAEPSATTLFTNALLEAFAPWLVQDATGDLSNYLATIGGMLDAVAQIVSDQNFVDDSDYVPGWSVLLDPSNCPSVLLPFLAQFVGVNLSATVDPTAALSAILAEAGFQRGTLAAIIAVAQQYLIATQSCIVIERTKNTPGDDAYRFLMIVRPEEVTSVSALVAAVNGVKPAGIQWTLVQTDGFTWAEAVNIWNADSFSWNAAAFTQP